MSRKPPKSPQKKQLQRLWGLAAVPVQLHSPLQALAQDICREAPCGQRCQPAARVLPSPGCAQGANTVHLHHPAQGCPGKWPRASSVSLCKAEFMLCLCGMTGSDTSPPGRRGNGSTEVGSLIANRLLTSSWKLPLPRGASSLLDQSETA